MSHAGPPQEPNPWSAEIEVAALLSAARTTQHNVPQAESLELTSVWQMASPEAAYRALTGPGPNFCYRRVEHPNAHSLASKLAMLHGAPRALLTAQGMSAIATVAMAQLTPGARVWLGRELYGETTQLLTRNLARWQVQVRLFDPCDESDLADLERAAPVELVIIETLTNPRIRVPDIARVASATHRAGGHLLVDNTFACHLLCRPLELGADYVVESLGKIVNGHSDGMLGLIAVKDGALANELAGWIKTCGWTSSPLDCYLTQRGLQSLAVRLQRSCDNALALAGRLSELPGIHQVDYPGLTNHSSHSIALRQFTGGYGWMLSFQVEPDPSRVERLFAALRPEICFVPSLGDASTTLSHPVTTSHRDTDPQLLEQLNIHHGTVRVSCGLEPTDWLLSRFTEALQSLD